MDDISNIRRVLNSTAPSTSFHGPSEGNPWRAGVWTHLGQAFRPVATLQRGQVCPHDALLGPATVTANVPPAQQTKSPRDEGSTKQICPVLWLLSPLADVISQRKWHRVPTELGGVCRGGIRGQDPFLRFGPS